MKNMIREILDTPGFCEGEHWRWREVPAGEIVFREGEPGQTLCLVVEGAVRISGGLALDDGRQIRPGVCDLGEGAVFGELVLFGDGMRTATVSAIRDTRLIEIDGEALLAFFDAHPELGYRAMRRFMEIAVERLRLTNRKLMSVLAWGLRVHDIEQHL